MLLDPRTLPEDAGPEIGRALSRRSWHEPAGGGLSRSRRHPDRGRHYLRDPDEVRLLPGAAEAVRRLNEAASRLSWSPTSPGIARGLLTEDGLPRHRAAARRAPGGGRRAAGRPLPLPPPARVSGPCECRKPGPLLYRRAAADSVSTSPTAGGSAIGCATSPPRTVRRPRHAGPDRGRGGRGEHRRGPGLAGGADLAAAVHLILARRCSRHRLVSRSGGRSASRWRSARPPRRVDRGSAVSISLRAAPDYFPRP